MYPLMSCMLYTLTCKHSVVCRLYETYLNQRARSPANRTIHCLTCLTLCCPSLTITPIHPTAATASGRPLMCLATATSRALWRTCPRTSLPNTTRNTADAIRNFRACSSTRKVSSKLRGRMSKWALYQLTYHSITATYSLALSLSLSLFLNFILYSNSLLSLTEPHLECHTCILPRSLTCLSQASEGDRVSPPMRSLRLMLVSAQTNALSFLSLASTSPFSIELAFKLLV